MINEYQFNLNGKEATLGIRSKRDILDVEEWMIFFDGEEEGIELPNEIIKQLNEFTQPSNINDEELKLNGHDSFSIAYFADGVWIPNLKIASTDITKVNYTGQVTIQIQINKSGEQLKIKEEKKKDIEAFIMQLDRRLAFIEDFYGSAKNYTNQNMAYTLPLLAYYGGKSITTEYNEATISYKPNTYQAYKNALIPDRFDFKDFIEWFNTLNDEIHIKNLVCKTIVEALNIDQNKIYVGLEMKKGQLILKKKVEEDGDVLDLEIRQLSAGEQNLLALTGDLVKRAIQLNKVYFEVDVNEEVGTFSNPLKYSHGIVLIDEIDLHLHPKWQRQIVPKLKEFFPLVQFIITTHSPLVLQAASPNQRIRLNNWLPEYFKDDSVKDYEATMIDYFMVFDFFDVDTENQLQRFRLLLRQVVNKEIDRKDSNLKEVIGLLSAKGDMLKYIIAFELAQLKHQINLTNDENR